MKKLFTVLPLVLATSAAMAYEQDKTYQFTILHTNDTHGHFWPNAKGEYGFPAPTHGFWSSMVSMVPL